MRDAGMNKQFLVRLRTLLLQTFHSAQGEQAANVAMDLLDTAMVGRSLKSIMDAHLAALLFESDTPPNLAGRLQVLNEVMGTFFKAPEFLRDSVLPVARLKFRATDGTLTTIHPAHLKLGTIARMLSDKFAVTFDAKLRRFVGFTEECVLSGHTGRSAVDGTKASVTRRIHDLLRQATGIKATSLVFNTPPYLSVAAKLAPAVTAIGFGLSVVPETYLSSCVATEKDLYALHKEKPPMTGHHLGKEAGERLLNGGTALFWGLRSQLLCADMSTEPAVLDRAILNEATYLSGALRGANPSSLNIVDVEYIVGRGMESLRASSDAVAHGAQSWIVIAGTVLQRVGGTATMPPVSHEYERDIEAKATVRRWFLSLLTEVPEIGNEVCRLYCKEVVGLASGFPRSRQLPSLLLLGIIASFVLQDEIRTNVEQPDLEDATVLKHLWDHLLMPHIPLWLMVADGCISDAGFEDALGKVVTDDDAVTLLQFIQMVSKVGFVQTLVAEDRGVYPDSRKALVGEFAAFFRSQAGPTHLESKLRKAQDDVDRLMEPFRH